MTFELGLLKFVGDGAWQHTDSADYGEQSFHAKPAAHIYTYT